MASRSISLLLRTQTAPMARQKPLPAFPRHVSRTLSKRSIAAFGLRAMSTETPAPEAKDDSTASAQEKAKTGTPPVADSKEDSITKLKEERDDLVVRLSPQLTYPSLLAYPFSCLSKCMIVHAESSTVCPSRLNKRTANRQRRKRKDAGFCNHTVCIRPCRDGGHARLSSLVFYVFSTRFIRHCTHQCDRTYAGFAYWRRTYA